MEEITAYNKYPGTYMAMHESMGYFIRELFKLNGIQQHELVQNLHSFSLFEG